MALTDGKTNAGTDEKITINLLIGNQQHNIIVLHSQEALFRKAAAEINAALSSMEQKYPQQTPERYLSTVLLQYASRFIQLEGVKSTQPLCDAMAVLTQEIEETLNND